MLRTTGKGADLSVGHCLDWRHDGRRAWVGVASAKHPSLQHHVELHSKSIPARARVFANLEEHLGSGPYHHPSVSAPWPYSPAALEDFVGVAAGRIEASALAARLLGRDPNFAANVVAPSLLQLAEDMFVCEAAVRTDVAAVMAASFKYTPDKAAAVAAAVDSVVVLSSPDLSSPAVAAFVSRGSRGNPMTAVRGGDVYIFGEAAMWNAAAGPLTAMIREQSVRLLQHCVDEGAPDAPRCRALLDDGPRAVRPAAGAVALAEFLQVGPAGHPTRWKEFLQIVRSPAAHKLRNKCHVRAHPHYLESGRNACTGGQSSKFPAECMLDDADTEAEPLSVAASVHDTLVAAGVPHDKALLAAGRRPCMCNGDGKNWSRLDAARHVQLLFENGLAI